VWQLRQLEAFEQAMIAGSLTRAAEKLNVSQPAISKLISTLENKCGFAVFIRRGNRLQPTPEGKLLYTEIQRIFASSHMLERKVIEIREQQVGTLRIAAFPAMATRVLPGIIKKYCEEKPQVQVLLTSRSSVFMNDWMSSQRMDLGIGVLPANDSNLANQRVLSLDAVCVLPVGHRLANESILTPEQIALEPLINLGTEDKARFLIDQFFTSANVKSFSHIQTQISEAACQFVVEGAGIAIVDPICTLGFNSDQLIVKPLSQRLMFDLWLITPTSHESSLMARSFMEHFSDSIKKILTKKNFRFE
jgi:DNA-binding transcriptional LysR family regulator